MLTRFIVKFILKSTKIPNHVCTPNTNTAFYSVISKFLKIKSLSYVLINEFTEDQVIRKLLWLIQFHIIKVFFV